MEREPIVQDLTIKFPDGGIAWLGDVPLSGLDRAVAAIIRTQALLNAACERSLSEAKETL